MTKTKYEERGEMRNKSGLLSSLLIVGFYCQPIAYSADTITSDSATAKAPATPTQEVKVDCIDPHACCEESSKVIGVLQDLVKSINNGDWKTYETMLDDHCSTFDEGSHKLIAGKENVVADMKKKVDLYAAQGHPLVSVTIDQPYAKVMPPGDTAVVNFVAIRQYGGKHPFKEECHATDIFVKRTDGWKKCHFRGAWKRA
jgi:hypothetical protein